MKVPQKWKKFEQAVKSIQEQLTPDSKIIYDYRTIGRTTGVERQVDIALFSTIGQFDIFIAMDCKDYNKPVDVKEVESFATMLEDIRADKGVLVTYKGYTSAAKKVAESKRIELLQMIDVESKDWPVKVSIPMIMDLRGIEKMQVCISSSYPSPLVVPPVDPRYLVAFNEDGSCLGTLTNILTNKWNNGEISNEVGKNNFNLIKIYIHDDKNSYPCDITINYTVPQEIYFGQIGLSELKGFFKHSDKSIITKKIVTEKISFQEIEKSWTKVNSLKDIEQQPTIHIVVLGEYEQKYDF